MKYKITTFIFVLLLLLCISLSCGTKLIFPWDIFEEPNEFIIFQLRLPRTLSALFGGGALAVSGLILQTLFVNPLSGPFVLGIASGALAGSVLMVLMGLGAGLWVLTMGSLLGAVIMTMLVLAVSSYLMNRDSILLVGLMSGYFLAALVNILIVFAPAATVKDYHIWTLGSFGRVQPEAVGMLCVFVFLVVLLCFLLSKRLNALSVGEEYAFSLGFNIKKNRFLFLLFSSLLTAMVTAFVGPVAFIGLAAPHMAKLIVKKSDHFILVPFVFCFGGMAGLSCDLIARLAFPPHDLPVGLVSSILGGPFILFLILRNVKR